MPAQTLNFRAMNLQGDAQELCALRFLHRIHDLGVLDNTCGHIF
jgi:hypothetical protein